MLYLAILAGKLISFTTKLLKIGGGSAAPGHYALKIDPNLVSELLRSIPKQVVITGTNGKTTTARMLAHFAKDQGLKIIHNNTGSNLERGIASALISHTSTFNSHIPCDLAIWELDEAAFNTVGPKLNPTIVCFLNVYRDQLDRYGEVDSVVSKWVQTLEKMTSGVFLINANDPSLTSLINTSANPKLFAIKDQVFKGESRDHAIKAQDIAYEVSDVELKGLSGSSFKVTVGRDTYHINLPLPGLYHIYDFLAAFSLGLEMGLEPQKMIESLQSYKAAFGRVERVSLGKNLGYIFLIKNPAGATQVLQILQSELQPDDRLLLALNDNFADGTDVSWIWDTEFELLLRSSYQPTIIVSGQRADELALRLKYANLNKSKVLVEKGLFKALELSREGFEGRLFILPTYTALLELQKILAKLGLKRRYWEE